MFNITTFSSYISGFMAVAVVMVVVAVQTKRFACNFVLDLPHVLLMHREVFRAMIHILLPRQLYKTLHITRDLLASSSHLFVAENLSRLFMWS